MIKLPKEESKQKEEFVRLTIPIPKNIYSALKEMSEKEERSLTSQIIYILKENITIETKKNLTARDLREMAKKILESIDSNINKK